MSDERELDVQLLSILGINPFAAHNSSPRAYMFSSHISQSVLIEGKTEKRIQTGLEQEFGKYVFNCKMPSNGKIIAILEKYRTDSIVEDFKINPAVYIIFEDIDNNQFDYIEVPNYRSFHQTFGFKLIKNQKAFENLRVGEIIPKDTIIAESESISEVGGYKFGIELNVALMSHPAVAEDGILISEDVLERLAFTKYEKKTVEFGESTFPLNLYGDDNNYKPFPDIGEKVREDSLLIALREYDNDIAPAIMGVKDCQKIDYMFDKMYYASSPDSYVIDLKVIHNENSNYVLPQSMDSNIQKYAIATKIFYKKLLEIYNKIRREHRQKYGPNAKVNLSHNFHRLLVESLIMTENGGRSASDIIIKKYRNSPLDTYKIEFTLATRVVPSLGYKCAGTSGDKGVIVAIEKPENMPVDKDGVRADIIVDDLSPINRTNLGKLYEHYIGRVCFHIKFILREQLGLDKHKKYLEREIRKLINDSNYNNLRNTLLEFYSLVSDDMYINFNALNKAEFIEHLAHVVSEGPYLYITPNHPKNPKDIVKDLLKKYNVRPGPVRMRDPQGKEVITKENVLIGPIYMMLLEKIADSWSAIASGKYQHFGVLSTASNADKFQYPYRNTSVRTVGETESRVYTAYTPLMNIAEVMDRNNNTVTHREVINSIMSADMPTNIQEAVNRNVVHFGSVKPLQYVKHILMCAGMEFKYYDSDMKFNKPTYKIQYK